MRRIYSKSQLTSLWQAMLFSSYSWRPHWTSADESRQTLAHVMWPTIISSYNSYGFCSKSLEINWRPSNFQGWFAGQRTFSFSVMAFPCYCQIGVSSLTGREKNTLKRAPIVIVKCQSSWRMLALENQLEGRFFRVVDMQNWFQHRRTINLLPDTVTYISKYE